MSFAHDLNMLFLYLLLSFMSSLYVWNNSPLSDISFEILAAGFQDMGKNGQIKFYKLGDFYTVNKQHGPIAH